MEETRQSTNSADTLSASPPHGADVEKPPAWEMIAPGRYQPRRIRGSLLGRELG